MQQQQENKRIKRALSDQFNNDQEAITKLEEELTQKYNKLLGIQQETNPIKIEKAPEMDLLQKLSQEFGISLDDEPKRKSSVDNIELLAQESFQTLKQHPPGINVKLNLGTPKIETPSQLPYVLDDQQKKYKGKLKIFFEDKKYGFLILDDDGTDVFVHQDDLKIAGITVENIKQYSTRHFGSKIHFEHQLNTAPYFEFTIMNYIGKYNKSRKAIELKIIK